MVGPRVADVRDDDIGAERVSAGQRGPHALQPRIRVSVIQQRLVDHVGVGLDAVLDGRQIEVVQFRDPAARAADQLVGRPQRQTAGQFAKRSSAHAVRHKHHMRFVVRQREVRRRHVGQQHLARTFAANDRKVVFVVAAHIAQMGTGPKLDLQGNLPRAGDPGVERRRFIEVYGFEFVEFHDSGLSNQNQGAAVPRAAVRDKAVASGTSQVVGETSPHQPARS